MPTNLLHHGPKTGPKKVLKHGCDRETSTVPALLRLPTNLTALQANYNSAFLLRLNVCNDLAKAMKALDRKKICREDIGVPLFEELTSRRKIKGYTS